MTRDHFPFLIGGEGWAFELTEIEWSGLVAVIFELTKEYNQLHDQLMPEECVCLELEKELWWGCLDGDKWDWTLQIVLLKDNDSAVRGVEAHWPKPSARAFVEAMRTMWDCHH